MDKNRLSLGLGMGLATAGLWAVISGYSSLVQTLKFNCNHLQSIQVVEEVGSIDVSSFSDVVRSSEEISYDVRSNNLIGPSFTEESEEEYLDHHINERECSISYLETQIAGNVGNPREVANVVLDNINSRCSQNGLPALEYLHGKLNIEGLAEFYHYMSMHHGSIFSGMLESLTTMEKENPGRYNGIVDEIVQSMFNAAESRYENTPILDYLKDIGGKYARDVVEREIKIRLNGEQNLDTLAQLLPRGSKVLSDIYDLNSNEGSDGSQRRIALQAINVYGQSNFEVIRKYVVEADELHFPAFAREVIEQVKDCFASESPDGRYAMDLLIEVDKAIEKADLVRKENWKRAVRRYICRENDERIPSCGS